MRPDLMLFCAGLGSRMGALTADRSKPMIEVAGRPLVDHALALADGRVGRRIANTHHRPRTIAAHLEAQGVTVLHEPTLLDTGGGLKAALPHLRTDPVMTLNTDAVWRGASPLDRLLGAWAPEMEALMLLVPRSRAVGRGARPGNVVFDGASRLRWGDEFVHTGALLMRPHHVAERPERIFSNKAVWEEMEARGTLHGVVWDGLWCDVGSPDGLAAAEEMLR